MVRVLLSGAIFLLQSAVTKSPLTYSIAMVYGDAQLEVLDIAGDCLCLLIQSAW